MLAKINKNFVNKKIAKLKLSKKQKPTDYPLSAFQYT